MTEHTQICYITAIAFCTQKPCSKSPHIQGSLHTQSLLQPEQHSLHPPTPHPHPPLARPPLPSSFPVTLARILHKKPKISSFREFGKDFQFSTHIHWLFQSCTKATASGRPSAGFLFIKDTVARAFRRNSRFFDFDRNAQHALCSLEKPICLNARKDFPCP